MRRCCPRCLHRFQLFSWASWRKRIHRKMLIAPEDQGLCWLRKMFVPYGYGGQMPNHSHLLSSGNVFCILTLFLNFVSLNVRWVPPHGWRAVETVALWHLLLASDSPAEKTTSTTKHQSESFWRIRFGAPISHQGPRLEVRFTSGLNDECKDSFVQSCEYWIKRWRLCPENRVHQKVKCEAMLSQRLWHSH